MMPAQSRVDAGIWTVPGLAPVIEYSRAVLNEILIEVVEAYDTYLAGGYEVGGVLFGQHEADAIHILAYRPLQIQPPRPSFVLSKGDEQGLIQLIAGASTDPELAGMEVVGWYHSHTRSEVFLSEADTEIYDKYFAEPWQIAMVLHPGDSEPVRIGFFFRESDGYIRTDQSYQEFAVDAPVRIEVSRKQPPWEVTVDGRVKEEPLPNIEPETYFLPPEPGRQPLWRQVAKYAVLLFCALAAIGAGTWSVLVLREPDPTMGLKLTPVEGELLIQWDPKSPALEAGDPILFITDGKARVDIAVDRRKMKLPQYTYKPLTGRVDVRLRTSLSWGRTRQELASYLAHPDIGKPSPELLEAQRQQAKAQEEADDASVALRQSAEEAAGLQARVEDLNQRRMALAQEKKQRSDARRLALKLGPKPVLPKELPTAPEIAARSVAIAAPPPGQLDSRNRPPAPPPTAIEPPKPSLIPPTSAVRPAVAPAVTPPAAPSSSPLKGTYSGPTSGRIIWTGDLPKDGVLTIDGRRSSRGAVNSELPGVPVRIGAYPAELTNTGLRVITPNPKTGAGKVEPPSATNGYTSTQYVYDSKSVRDLIVEQLPAGQDLHRIVVRGGRRLSAIVIEWQVVSQ